MAEGPKHLYEFGYPDERFETILSENLHCAICSCVFKDPVMCKNEHCFCRGCITKHLENHQNCPSCHENLTVKSLADAPRILRNLLAEQKIRCDHHERGCEELAQLGNLASHVAVCGKAPVVCANEECSNEINREDQLRHETEECRFREVKWRNCKEMEEEIGSGLGGLCEQVAKLNSSVNEMKTGLTAIENKLEGMENKLENKFEEMQNRFEKMEKLFLNMESDPRFRDGKLRKMQDMETARSDQAIAIDPSIDLKDGKVQKEFAYLVAGGYGNSRYNAEIFDKTNHSWRQLQPMETCRISPSSVVYNGQVLVSGGASTSMQWQRDRNILSTIDVFSPNTNPIVPPNWSNFPVNLPRALCGHHSVVYKDRMLVIGGYDEEKKDYSDIIYEIMLHIPFTTKILAIMPTSTIMHGCGVVLVNDKILIFGGRGRDQIDPAIARVMMYDLTKNEVKELAPLPYKVYNMATAKFEENVILAGGSDGSITSKRRPDTENSKNTVVSYNVETQKSDMLPPMQNERSGCCAVVDGHSLVVIGGENKKGDVLNSVEAFDFRTSTTWRSLPSMNDARKGFTAEIV